MDTGLHRSLRNFGCFLTLKVIYNQARDARDQARDARADSQKAIELTKILAEAARSSADAGKETAKATATNADVAKQTANAIMRRERAWVLIEREPATTQDRIQEPYLPTAEQMMAEQHMPHCIFFFRNEGRTAARIITSRAELQISANPNVLPDASIYDTSETFKFPDILPPSQSSAEEATFRNLAGIEDLIAVNKHTEFLWLCGIIKYVDIFEQRSRE